ncbi:Gfo/Idh/MocA family protein [Halorussus salinus]|uniref:Gfo/Idh/MocA family protein n=1 Tax=Halorussus salinus TaxID=1364935 RepID=UPI0010924A4C|nr:Gfo/Idh/MocA family oxidoreductase [Halorussus salinus]
MTVRVGAIGLGTLGRIECRAYTELDDVEFVAGADVSADVRAEFRDTFDVPVYEDYQTMVSETDLDAVNIVTPHTLHYDQTIACLDAGLSVFLEKPMVTDLERAHSLVERVTDSDQLIQVGYQRHFDPRFTEIRRLIANGEIGRPHTANLYLGQDWIDVHEGSWRTNPELSGGGQLYDSGSHALDTLLWTLDAEPQTVAAVADAQTHDVDVNSALAMTLKTTAGNVTASVCLSGDGTNPAPEEGFIVFGTDGHLVYDTHGVTVITGDDRETRSIDAPDFETLVERKLGAFVEAVETGEPSPVPPEYGRKVTAVTEAAYEAIETGETVSVASTPREQSDPADASRNH